MLNLDDFSEENPTMRSQSVDGVKYLVPPIHPLDVQETQIENISIEVVEDTHDPTTPVENISIGTTSPVKSIAKSILKKNKPKSFIGFQQVHQPVYSNFKFNLNSTKKKSGIFSTMNIISR